jgi:alcohol dehydrogenase (cytochrome c)
VLGVPASNFSIEMGGRKQLMKSRRLILAGVIVVLGTLAAGIALRTKRAEMIALVGFSINYYRSWSAPPGTTQTEMAAAALDDLVAPSSHSPSGLRRMAATGDWPSYNKTLTSERYSPLGQINANNVASLRALCTYDTHQFVSFEVGLIMVNGALIGTTEHDIFSLDPANCHQNWRTSENYESGNLMRVNRGAAYSDGLLFRGTGDGRVLAYNFKDGRRVWETSIANPNLGETIPAAPIAWNGLVFIGNAGGDNKGVKGRMYALDAKSGRIVWEFYLVPKTEGDPTRGPQGDSPLDRSTWKGPPATPISGGATWTSYTLDPTKGVLYVPGGNPAPDFAIGPRAGENLYSGSVVALDAMTGAYKFHFKIVPKDWHDWDVSAAPAVIRTKSGRSILSVAPKDGFLYGFDLATNTMLYRTPVTRMENIETPFVTDRLIHFCPGPSGGAEWNGPAFDPQTNLIFVGENDWCSAVRLQSDKQLQAVKPGVAWSGMATRNPYATFGKFDPYGNWAGWVYAVDADSGDWKWRLKSNYPVVSGVTPTAGGLVFFGDMGGNFYAVDATSGRRLWGMQIGGAIGGGVITYTVNGLQKVAVAIGITSLSWPTKPATGKVVILGLGDVPNRSSD